MSNYEETRYNFDGANLQDVEGVNTGIVLPWSNGTAPSGFLECNGAAVSRTTYATLFAVIGTTWGVGDGATTFNVPDFTDKCCVNSSPTKSFASTGGANTVAGSGNVTGSTGNTTLAVPTIASHNHPGSSGNTGGGTSKFFGGLCGAPGSTGAAGGGGAHNHPLSGTFTGDSNSVLQPYLTVMYIIKT
jgi:microcystin-dependent protein